MNSRGLWDHLLDKANQLKLSSDQATVREFDR